MSVGVGLSGVTSSCPMRSPRRTRRCGWGVRKSCLRASGVLADLEIPAGDASGAMSATTRTRRAASADGRSAEGAAEATEGGTAGVWAGLSTSKSRGASRPFWLCRDPLWSAELRGAEAEAAEPEDAPQDGGGAVGRRLGVPDG